MEHTTPLPFLREVILFLVLTGVLIPLLQRFRINQMPGFLVVGVLVGPHGLARRRDAMDQPGGAMHTVGAARSDNPALPVFARSRDAQYSRDLAEAGATAVVPETLEAGLQLSSFALHSTGIRMRDIDEAIDAERGGRVNTAHTLLLPAMAGLLAMLYAAPVMATPEKVETPAQRIDRFLDCLSIAEDRRQSDPDIALRDVWLQRGTVYGANVYFYTGSIAFAIDHLPEKFAKWDEMRAHMPAGAVNGLALATLGACDDEARDHLERVAPCKKAFIEYTGKPRTK